MEKRQILGIVLLIVLGIVGLVTVLSVIGGMSETLKTSAKVMAYPNNCTYVYNASDNSCYNSTELGGGKFGYTPTLYQLPMSGLFTPTGIAVTLLMVALFVAALIFVIGIWRNK